MVTLRLPLPPNVANRETHWRRRRREDRAYKDLVWGAVRQQRAHRTFAAGVPTKVRVTAHFRLWNPMDEDNLAARLKPALDALKGDFFVDDSPAHLELAKPTQEVNRRDRGLTLTIEPIEGPA